VEEVKEILSILNRLWSILSTS